MAGRIEGNERGGRFTLSGRDAGLELPQVFPEAHLQLSELAAEGSWSHPRALEVTLASASFANEDARGSAAGRYRATPDTPGRIDLQARLSRPMPPPCGATFPCGGQGGPRLAATGWWAARRWIPAWC
jgi:uncharacterized protein YhdP